MQHQEPARRDELIELIRNGSTDPRIYEEVKKFNEAQVALRKERKLAVASIVEKMLEAKPPISIKELVDEDPSMLPSIEAIYDINAFKAGANSFGVTFRANGRKSGASSAARGRDLGPPILVIKVPGAKGQPMTIFKNSDLPPDTSSANPLKNSFLHVKGKGKDIAASLRSFVPEGSTEAKQFLATEEGNKFIARWAGWISRDGKRKDSI